MKVLKFGGSSVATPERIEQVVEILKGYYQRGEQFTVVFSAFGGVTDSLIAMSEAAAAGDKGYLDLFQAFSERHFAAAHALLDETTLAEAEPILTRNHEVLKNLLYGIFLVREASLRTMDYVLSFGERNSAFIIAHTLRKNGIPAAYLDARKIVRTDQQFGAAKVDFEVTYAQINQYYQQHPEIQVVTGFVGSAGGGLTTTLGRGGSDYSAAIIAAGLQAEHIEIWTDVDGVLTADPRKVPHAFSIPTMTYQEAMEMSHFGAKVIYPPTLQPALKRGIPLTIKNTFNATHPGTLITRHSDPNGEPIKGISSIGKVALLTLSGSGLFGVPGTAGRLFSTLAAAKINVILITQGSSEHAISFAVQPQAALEAQREVESAFAYEIERGIVDRVKLEEELSVVAVIGENMRYQPGISGKMFQALGKNGINCVAIAQGSSELNISVVISKEDEAKALNALHEFFFDSDLKTLHVYMVGVGLIGSTLLRQIEEQNDTLREMLGMEIKVVGLANSKKQVFDENGLELANWKAQLTAAEMPSSISAFVQKMKQLNLRNSIFVDNTANSQIANFYEQILNNAISISTPNKIATSGSFLHYQRLKTIAKKRNVKFAYETNVGAGLPVITTIADLMNSGDQILKLEGVLSGSLSFIFNAFGTDDRSFSDIVLEAQEKGFTEPDPRIDLNGVDVRRKLLILARETGLPLEAADIDIDPVLPKAVRDAASVADFFDELKKADAYFTKLQQETAQAGKVLRMIAALDNGRATISLQSVSSDHPFASLNGSDNMLVLTTTRYRQRPLVIRGPGAGAEVTAAGVFAEVISIGNYLV